MESFLHGIASVTIILMLTATGWFCGAKGWMNAQSKAFISKFLLSMAVPCMCIYGLRSNLTREMLASSPAMVAAPFLCNALNFTCAFGLSKLLCLPRRQSGVFVVMCGLSNAMFIGYAMCTELFGSECAPYVILYYLASTCFTQTIAMWLIRRSADNEGGGAAQALKFLRSPTVIGLVVGFTLVLLDVTPPSFVMSYLRYMNNVVSPLALLLTGYIIYEMGWDKLRLNRTLAVMMAFRFLFAPGVYTLLCAVFGIGGLARSTFIVEASMPVVTQTVVAAAQYGADEQLAAEGAALTTLASFLVIPVLMLLL
ncbi:MAG: AEC family transporter [Ruminococcaceae bacterium]|nr:AEC family transporter [Oscillospiraceae bacterium]